MITTTLLTSHVFLQYLYTKLGVLLTTLTALNKIKLNSLILFLIIVSYRNLLRYNFFSIISVFFVYFHKIRAINFLLTFIQGMFKIHPPLFYLSLVLFLTYHNSKSTYTKLRLIANLSISITSIILGGVWALYQLNWGFYWSTDPIELALFFVIACYLYTLHTFEMRSYWPYLFFYTTILYIYIIRNNLIYTKHNFFNNASNSVIFIKSATMLVLVNICSTNYTPLYVTTKRNSLLTWLLVCITILFFNLTYNRYIKLLTGNVMYLLTAYLIGTIEWATTRLIFLHAILFISLNLFYLFKMQYIYNFLSYIALNIKATTQFQKTLVCYPVKNNFNFINITTKVCSKSNNIYATQTINTVRVRKKLLNYFI